MSEIALTGSDLDLEKSIFQIHGVDNEGNQLLKKRLQFNSTKCAINDGE